MTDADAKFMAAFGLIWHTSDHDIDKTRKFYNTGTTANKREVLRILQSVGKYLDVAIDDDAAVNAYDPFKALTS